MFVCAVRASKRDGRQSNLDQRRVNQLANKVDNNIIKQ